MGELVKIKSLAVFCGSYAGKRPEYAQAADALAQLLVSRDITLIYGGGNVGLMGILANTMMQKKGRVIGIIPKFLVDREVAHRGLTELRVVDSMHERKAMMTEMADGFVALPGGVGTLEEFSEILTWSLLGLHQKPLGLMNVENYYANLINFFQNAVDEGFVSADHITQIAVAERPHDLLMKFAQFKPLVRQKWIKEPSQT